MKHLFIQMSSSINRRGAADLVSPLRIEFLLVALSGFALVCLLGAHLADAVGVAVATVIFVLGMTIAAFGMHRSYTHDTLGMCNFITVIRLALTASLASLLVSPKGPDAADLWVAFTVASIALLLDGADGWAARRAGLASRFGARFDMEVDSLFALVLALIAIKTGQAGPWVLALGLPRYLFFAAAAVWPVLGGELPDSLGRKAVCVLQIGALVAFLLPVLPAIVQTTAAAIATIGLAWSFLRDIRHLTAAAR